MTKQILKKMTIIFCTIAIVFSTTTNPVLGEENYETMDYCMLNEFPLFDYEEENNRIMILNEEGTVVAEIIETDEDYIPEALVPADPGGGDYTYYYTLRIAPKWHFSSQRKYKKINFVNVNGTIGLAMVLAAVAKKYNIFKNETANKLMEKCVAFAGPLASILEMSVVGNEQVYNGSVYFVERLYASTDNQYALLCAGFTSTNSFVGFLSYDRRLLYN